MKDSFWAVVSLFESLKDLSFKQPYFLTLPHSTVFIGNWSSFGEDLHVISTFGEGHISSTKVLKVPDWSLGIHQCSWWAHPSRTFGGILLPLPPDFGSLAPMASFHKTRALCVVSDYVLSFINSPTPLTRTWGPSGFSCCFTLGLESQDASFQHKCSVPCPE